MLLPDIKLNSVEEFKNFSLNEIFTKNYSVKSGGDVKDILDIHDNKELEKFSKIYVLNGVPSSFDLPTFVEIIKNRVSELETFNPLLNLNNKYNDTTYEIVFNKPTINPVVIINYITETESFVPSNIKYTVKGGGVLNLLEITKQVSGLKNVFMNNRRELSIENSVVNYSRVDDVEDSTSVFYNYNGYVDSGTLNCVSLNNVGYFNMNNWNIDLVSPESTCNVYGVINLKNNSRFGTICKLNHLAPNTVSNQEFRHVLDGNSYGMYDGDSTVLNIAKESSTSQKSKTIMLSDGARILNKPRLNIYTGEVKATHGATVGKLNDDDIFYLKQRGLPDRVIKEMLINAFVIDVLDRIESEKIREYIYDKR